MGLDTSHGCWHGAYSAFGRWREEIARAAGLPPLEFMEGFWGASWNRCTNNLCPFERVSRDLPIRWDCLRPSPLFTLLHHSDYEGEIAWEECAAIADALEELLPKLPTEEDGGHIGDWRETTQGFIDGLRLAAECQENVEFH